MTAHLLVTATKYIGIASSGGSGLSQALTAFAAIIDALGTLTLGVAAVLALRKRQDAAARTTDAG
jgi:hypothetical protein